MSPGLKHPTPTSMVFFFDQCEVVIWDIKSPAVCHGKTEWPERLLSYALPEHV